MAISEDHGKPIFFLKFEVLVNGKPTETTIPEDRRDLQMRSPDLEISIELSKLTEELSSILGNHGISLTRVLHGKTFPLFVIKFHPPSSSENLPIADILCPEISEMIKNHFRATSHSFLFEVRLDLYVSSSDCSIDVHTCTEGEVFGLSRLLGSSTSSSKDFLKQDPHLRK